MKKLFGIDFGTGGCKSTVIDVNGNILASSFKEYPSIHLHQGWSEQNLEIWIDAFLDTAKNCRMQMKDGFDGVLGLAFSASAHNMVLIDKDDKVIRNCIMWNDQRSVKQCEELKKYEDIIFKIGMQIPTPTWTLPQLMWIKENEYDNYKRIKKLKFTKDYVRSFVTGDFVTDIVDAQGSLLFDALKNEWSKDICDIIELPISVLPEVKLSNEIVGYVSKKVSDLTGLPEGLPVINGCSDTAAEDFSAGAVSEGQIIVKIATAGNVNVVSKYPNPSRKTFTYPYSVQGMWYTVTATNSSALSYRWLRDSLYKTEYDLCKPNEDIYDIMDKNASEIDVGSKGLIFHPFLLGERCPYYNADLRANYFGVSMIHDKRHFTRAVLEGVAFSLYDCWSVLLDFDKDLDAKDIRLIGGGAKSELWSQIVCDVFGVDVNAPKNAESSYGGALLVGVGIGYFKNEIEASEKCVKLEKVYKPNMENHKIYKDIFKIYKDIVYKNADIWEQLSKLN